MTANAYADFNKYLDVWHCACKFQMADWISHFPSGFFFQLFHSVLIFIHGENL